MILASIVLDLGLKVKFYIYIFKMSFNRLICWAYESFSFGPDS